MIRRGCLLTLFCVLMGANALGRDGWAERPSVCDMPPGPRLERCQEWVATVKTPDTRTSCCGTGDSYMADDFLPGPDGGYYAVVSADYPDGYGGADAEGNPLAGVPGFKRGDMVLIPKEKINFLPEDANRSGHGVFFFVGVKGAGYVVCAFLPALI